MMQSADSDSLTGRPKGRVGCTGRAAGPEGGQFFLQGKNRGEESLRDLRRA